MTRNLLLDLDGTLVDSAPDIASAVNHVLAKNGLAPLSTDHVASMIGNGTRALLTRACAARGRSELIAGLQEDFVQEYHAHVSDRSTLYPSVVSTLERLRAENWRFAICTNKPESLARRLLASLKLEDMFTAVVGGDSVPAHKPDPRHVLATLAACSGDTQSAIMVGDHANDVVAAKTAGIPCVFAAWGYGRRSMAKGATATAESFDELPDIVAGILSHAVDLQSLNQLPEPGLDPA